MLIAIPSKGRAGMSVVKTPQYLGDAGVLFVPELEVGAYETKYPGTPVVGVPQSVRGITPTRNWILNNTGEERVVFVDDDLKAAGWCELLETNAKQRALPAPVVVEQFERLFDIGEALNLRVWGTATQAATRSVYPYRPFIFRTYVTASCMGIFNKALGDKAPLRFDERYITKEDYEICLRAIIEDGGVLGARYFYWQNSHWKDEGGCAEYRTRDLEDRMTRQLMRQYPGMVRRAPNADSEHTIQLTL